MHTQIHTHACTPARTRAHTHTHIHTHTHEHTDYTKLNLHSLKQAANRDLWRMKTAECNGKHGRSVVGGKEMFWGYTWMSPEALPCRWTEDRKGAGTSSIESGARNLEASSSCRLWMEQQYWAVQEGLLTPLSFARHHLSPLAAFTSGAYFLHIGRRWQWICKFYTANFKGIFGGL